MKEEFIRFDNFLVKKNEIIFAVLSESKNSIELTIKDGNSTKRLIMNYDNDWDAEKALNFLSVDTDAITTDHWKHSLVKQVYIARECAMECREEMQQVKKELNALRMELRRNRLDIKKDKKDE